MKKKRGFVKVGGATRGDIPSLIELDWAAYLVRTEPDEELHLPRAKSGKAKSL
jgi:hypothetical protein